MTFSTFLLDALHAVTSILQKPVIICLLLFICLTIIALGSLIAEYFVERRHYKCDVAAFLTQLKSNNPIEIENQIEECKLLRRQKNILLKVLHNRELSPKMAQSLSIELIAEQDFRYQKTLSYTDFIVKIGPMLGLMGTLIPLGPGLLALGQGDLKTLSDAFLAAFDTTIAGLAAAGVAFAISRVRKIWYEKDMSLVETLFQGILEVLYNV